MMRLAQIAGAAALAVIAGPALAWQAENRHDVNPLPGGGFEVVGRPGSGPVDYWCAAGDYGLRVLGTSGTRRIYITRARGPSVTSGRKSAVHFALELPQGTAPHTGVFLTVRRAGSSLSTAVALNYCLDHKNLEF